MATASGGQTPVMSASLRRLEGKIPDEDFALKADLEQRVLLNRHALVRAGVTLPARVGQPMPGV